MSPRDPKLEAAVLLTDEVHKALLAFLAATYPATSPVILATACAYLAAGMAAEVIQQTYDRPLGDRELDVVLEQGIFDTMRYQVRAHLRGGLPTRM